MQLEQLLTQEELELATEVATGAKSLYDLDELYEKLFMYYCNLGEMPYGTMKARDGDPFAWISDQLEKELIINKKLGF